MQPLLKLARKPLFWCALAVAVVAGVALAVWPREPTYQGRALSYWLDRLPPTIMTTPLGFTKVNSFVVNGGVPLNFSDHTAFIAVDTLGGRTLPILIKRLQSRNTPMRKLETILRSWAIRSHVLRPRPRDVFISGKWERGQAVTALVRLEKVASPALPALITLAKSDPDSEVRASALEVLRRLSPSDYAQIVAQTKLLSAAERPSRL